MGREELLALPGIGSSIVKRLLKVGINETGILAEIDMRELLSLGLVAPNIRRAISAAVLPGKGEK
ncbi:MAG TPA: hypothetical protein EYQ85_02190 [Candidatus Poseidoniales archaeon]|nr:hypothetical protein [Candidatus Poseidoniales archaeon]